MTSLIFDLDNTLYPHNPQVEADFAKRIKEYFFNHLSMDFENEGFNWEKASVNIGAYLDEIFKGKEKQRLEFLNYICDVDVSSFAPNPELNRLLKHLPHDKYIFTDSTLRHVQDTLNQIGVDLGLFKGIFENADSGFRFKTDPQCHRSFLAKYRLKAEDCILFEDNLNNLLPAAEMGITTVLISPRFRGNASATYQFSDILTALKAMF